MRCKMVVLKIKSFTSRANVFSSINNHNNAIMNENWNEGWIVILIYHKSFGIFDSSCRAENIIPIIFYSVSAAPLTA